MPNSLIPTSATAFVTLSTIARLSASTADLNSLLKSTLSTCLDQLPLSGAVVWLRASENDMFAPAASRVPAGCSTSAVYADDKLLLQLMDAEYLLLDQPGAQGLILLPETMSLMLAPIRSEDILLGLLGFVGEREPLEPLGTLLEASANVLSGPTVSAWLRRQQEEAENVQATLFRFAEELRKQPGTETILGTLNNLALRLFDCDWSAVYSWQIDEFFPIRITTRVGEQPLDDEPALSLEHNPLLEVAVSDPKLLSITDLRSQPNVLPVYLKRHALRGVVLVPLQRMADDPLGLLVLGYRAPLTNFSNRATALARGMARMVAVALEKTRGDSQ